MDVEITDKSQDGDLQSVLFVGKEYTKPGAVIGNCLFIFGTNEGGCEICTKPCLHPLATNDLISHFHNENVMMFDWIDDSSCIMVCKEPTTVSEILKERFHSVAVEESGIEWYKSNEAVEKQENEDEYGKKGKAIHVYARICLSSDIEHKNELRQAMIVRKIIRHRKEQKKKKEKQALRAIHKREKKKKQRINKRLREKEAKALEHVMETEVKKEE